MTSWQNFLQSSLFSQWTDSLVLAAVYAVMLAEVRHYLRLERFTEKPSLKILLYVFSYIPATLISLFLLIGVYSALWLFSLIQ